MSRVTARKDNPPEVDALYGLEPVFEPGDAEPARDGSANLQLRTVQCPYCGEPFETVVDFSAGSTSYIEDCAICCQPIEFTLEVANEGATARLQVSRSD